MGFVYKYRRFSLFSRFLLTGFKIIHYIYAVNKKMIIDKKKKVGGNEDFY